MAEVRDFNSYKRKKREKGTVSRSSNAAGNRFARETKSAEKETEKSQSKRKPEEIADKKADKLPKAPQGETNRRLKQRVRFIAVAVVIVVLAVISYVSWRDKKYAEAQLVSGINIVDSMESFCMNLDGNILQYSRDGMNLMDQSGAVIWNQTYEMQSPMVRTCKDVVAIADYNARTIYVANTKAPMGVIQTNLPIRDFCVASQGVVAAVLDDASVTWIYLYDKDGNPLANFRTTMGDSGYPLSVDISPSGQLVCVSYLTVEAAKTKTNVAFYNFGDVGKNQTDNFVGGYICDNSVIPRVSFFDDSHAYAIATDRIMFFSGNEIPQMDTQIMLGEDEIFSVWESDDYVGVVFSGGSSEGNYRLQVYDRSGKELFKKYMNEEYSGMLFSDRQIVMYSSEAWKVIGMNGEDRFEDRFDYSVRAIIPTKVSSRFVIVGPDRIDTVELR